MKGNLNMGFFNICNLKNSITDDMPPRQDQVMLLNGSKNMIGNMNLNMNKIIGILEGTEKNDGVNYGQVMLLSGSNIMDNNMNLGNNRIINVGDPILTTDVVNMKFLLSSLKDYVPLNGTIMTGNLNMANFYKIQNLPLTSTNTDAISYGQTNSIINSVADEKVDKTTNINTSPNYLTGGNNLSNNINLDVSYLVKNGISSGIITGGLVTKYGTSIISISPLIGFIINNSNPTNPYGTFINTNTQTISIITGYSVNYVFINQNSSIVIKTTMPQIPDTYSMLFLAKITLNTLQNGITIVSDKRQFQHNPSMALNTVLLNLQYINQGIIIYNNGNNMNINITSGSIISIGINAINDINNPNIRNFPALTLASFYLATQIGLISDNTSLIIPSASQYDNNGSLTKNSGSSTTATNHRIYMQTDGSLFLQYGQYIYNTLTIAVNSVTLEKFVVAPFLEDAILIAYISLTQNCTSLSSNSCLIYSGPTIGGTLPSITNQAPILWGSIKGNLSDQTDLYYAIFKVGMIMPWSGNNTTIPEGWIYCDGRVLNSTIYPDLFAIIGLTYGGFGSSGYYYFYLPDLRSKTIQGYSNAGVINNDSTHISQCNSIYQTLGYIGGDPSTNGTTTLTMTNLPALFVDYRNLAGGYSDSNDSTWICNGTGAHPTDQTDNIKVSDTNGNFGNNTPFNMMNPYIVMTWMIYAGSVN